MSRREPTDDEEDAIAAQDDDRAETEVDVAGQPPAIVDPGKPGKPGGRVVEHDDRDLRTAPGASGHSIVYEPRPVRTVDDLDPKVREHLKKAREAQRERIRLEQEADEAYEKGTPVEVVDPAKPAEAAPVVAAADPANPADPAAPAVAPAAPVVPPTGNPQAPPQLSLDPKIVKAWETVNTAQAALVAQQKAWESGVGARVKTVDDALEQLEFDSVSALRSLVALKVGSEDPAKIDALIDELYDDLTGHRLKLEADDGKKAKREARRSRVDLARYQREQRAEADKRQRDAEAERTRADADREAKQHSTWLSDTAPKDSYPWLRVNAQAGSLVADVMAEFKRHGQEITQDQAAAFADNQLKEFASTNFAKFKHLLVPDPKAPTTAVVPAVHPGALPGQAPTQPETPPAANSQQKRTLTNNAAATTPTKPPPPTKAFDAKEDPDEARRRSLSRWRANRQQQQRE